MYKKFKKIFLVMAILGILFTNAYSGEVREIQLIEDISAELLEESKEQEAVVTKQPVQQQTQEITEDKNVGAEQTKKEENKVVENKEENKPKEKIIKDETKELTEKVKEVKEVQEDKNLAIEEPENPEKDKQKYEMIKYYSADGVEWELPDNFRAVIVGDTKGNVIFAKDADTMYPLASVTKMMSLMVTFDEINAGNISLSDSVRISKNPLKYGGSGIPLKADQIFILEDLIKASAVYSANNATYAIAEYVGNGSVFSFVAKMNRKLKEYGLENQIKYHTPAGLPTRVTKQPMDEGTARGIYKLSIEALKYKKYIEIAGIKSTKIYNGKISIRNRNHLIGENGIYGIKTGFHKEAKYNIAVASKFEDIDVIIVVMGGETYKTRDGIVLSVLDILNNNYTVKNGLIKRK
ncbi:D-alanyl-D-alanine carboxypeptidase family protein [Fusobacterium hwasookii]|uniref:D-alanyl-D-alanine carboxypeptidase n=1 Tax=Fusobacterium hwasookii ChDC F206 TaxID=1307443 RepID=A0AAC9F0S7_9FUSO|nr:D-alanyl-D-alanine carboxypeptidase family protein [Fusobacterium hwasookii]ALQ34715.1 D-alanyl-D-alanine carboxypeptidase [Fusobacterium hwasookii ChDC F206]ALQ38599.1 D-alanyl-D-alanine carboxypeptidase [Fusobacterium hwasookii ChDC F300]QNE68998.1 serine hydrolase [Fusobacterium hwasookii]